MFGSSRAVRGLRTSRCESLEDRRLLAVVPEGFTESAIAVQLSSPTALDIAPDGRVFVTQQNGVIRVIEDDVLVPAPFAALPADGSGERGLEGIALDPEFAANGYVYIYYTAAQPQSHNRVSRITASGNQMIAGSEVILFEFPNLSTVGNPIWHMGGSIQVGPDEKLYVAVGDHQSSNLAQSLNSPFGKIHRINKDGSIPADNPFYNSTTGDNRAIWALGLRNPYSTIFDPASGRFYINDVGQGSWEEVNDGVAGRNYGWPTTEGDFNQATYPNFTRPVHAYSHAVGCAITGGSFYSPTTQQFPVEYQGQYFFAEFCAGQLRMFDPDSPTPVTNFLTDASFPIGLDVSADGTMYYMERGIGAGGADGTNLGSVHKVEYTANVPPSFSIHPQDQLASLGESATFLASASGTNPLTYQWQRRDAGAAEFVDIAGANASSYTIAVTALADDGAEFRVVATNPIDSATSNIATLTVTTNAPPVATIDLPTEGTTYNAGDTISYAGSGDDAEDGALAASQLTWWVDFHHHDHTHPFIAPTTGAASGSFVIPTSGETDPDVYYRIHLQVEDSIGLRHETFRDVSPNLSQITLAANVPGLELLLDGQPRVTPLDVTGVVNVTRTLEAPAIATVGGVSYGFVRWADGSTERERVISFPATPTAYEAEYAPVEVVYLSDLPFLGFFENGWGPIERDRSNGETGATDGNPITLNGQTYAKGLGVHAYSEVAFDVTASDYTRFVAEIGVDDETGANGSVNFEVYLDGIRVFRSAQMTGASPTQSLDIDVQRAGTLTLIVTDSGNGNGFDHADWADAKLIVEEPVAGPPSAPSHFAAVTRGREVIELSWTDNATNELGFRIERRIPNSLDPSWSPLVELGPNTQRYLDEDVTPSELYEYSIWAFNSEGDSDPLEPVAANTLPADLLQFNFQPAGSASYFEYIAETGQVYGPRGELPQYGWNVDNSAQTRDRDNPSSLDQRYDTFTHLQKPENPNATWELQVNDGASYTPKFLVHVAGGDPSFFDGQFQTLVEGTEMYDFTPSAGDPWAEGSAYVTVTDGRLTVASGPNAVNNKLSFIDVNPVPRVEQIEVIAGGGELDANIEFSETVVGVDLDDVVLEHDGAPVPFTAAQFLTTQDNRLWVLEGLEGLVTGPGSFVLRITATGSGIEDSGGAELLDGATIFIGCRILGDTDGSCDVDLDDLNNVRNNFGNPGPNAMGDADFDGDVDLDDLNAVRNAFGAVGAPVVIAPQRVITARLSLEAEPPPEHVRATDAVFARFAVHSSPMDGLPAQLQTRRGRVHSVRGTTP